VPSVSVSLIQFAGIIEEIRAKRRSSGTAFSDFSPQLTELLPNKPNCSFDLLDLDSTEQEQTRTRQAVLAFMVLMLVALNLRPALSSIGP